MSQMRYRLLGVLLVVGSVSGCDVMAGGVPSLGGTSALASDAPAREGSGPVRADAPVEGSAVAALDHLSVKGRAPKTGYARSEFGKAWTDSNTALWGGDSLSTRENILSRDLSDVVCKVGRSGPVLPPCVVQSGVLVDPYTGKTVNFIRGQQTSQLVPVDHVVSLGDAWQKGAQQLSQDVRVNLANDPLNLIATTRTPNSSKSDSDAATWLVPRKQFRCRYVARQVAVKVRYKLWVTKAEKDAIARILAQCPGEPLPSDGVASSRTE